MRFIPSYDGRIVLGENHFEVELLEGFWVVRWRGRFVEAHRDLGAAMDAAERFDETWPTEPNVALAAAQYRE